MLYSLLSVYNCKITFLFRKNMINSLVSNEEYSIEKAIVFSNRREISNKGKIVYLPIYYVMFLQPNE